jgi:hypothetical protein
LAKIPPRVIGYNYFNGGLKTADMDGMALQAIFTYLTYIIFSNPKNHGVVNHSSVGFQTNKK